MNMIFNYKFFGYNEANIQQKMSKAFNGMPKNIPGFYLLINLVDLRTAVF